MALEIIETTAHTTADGKLNLSLDVGVPDRDVEVTVKLKPKAEPEPVDENGWPIGFFEKFAGSMPELKRYPQGEFEKRMEFE